MDAALPPRGRLRQMAAEFRSGTPAQRRALRDLARHYDASSGIPYVHQARNVLAGRPPLAAASAPVRAPARPGLAESGPAPRPDPAAPHHAPPAPATPSASAPGLPPQRAIADVRSAVESAYGRLPPNVEVIHDPHARDAGTGEPWAARWQDGRITLNAAHLTRADAVWHLEHEAVHDLFSRLEGDPHLRATLARLEAILARYPHLRAAADGYDPRTRGEESAVRTTQALGSGPTRAAWRAFVEAVAAALTRGLGAGRSVWALRSAERIAAGLLAQARSNLHTGRLNTEAPATGETRYAHARDGGSAADSHINGLKNMFSSPRDQAALQVVLNRFGPRSPEVAKHLLDIAGNAKFGPEIARQVLTSLARVARKTARSKQADALVTQAIVNSQNLKRCLGGLAIAAKSGIKVPEMVRVLLNHRNILSPRYTAENLLTDTNRLGVIPGLGNVWKMMKIRAKQAMGFRFELESAADLKRKGHDVTELSFRIAVELDEGLKKTDSDAIIEGPDGVRVYCQMKRSSAALGKGLSGYASVKKWVSVISKYMGKNGGGKIIYVMPSGILVDPGIKEFLGQEKIEIVRLEHKYQKLI